jgi:nicotinate-nucleotide adenylyltransferase
MLRGDANRGMRRVGFFSGTFDPFHYAHLEACLIAKEICKLDEVVILLEHNPKHKQNVTLHHHRYNMIRLAVGEYKGFTVEDAPADNITFKSLQPLIQERYKDDELWYILGSDLLVHLPKWADVEEMLQNMHLCVVLRSNQDRSDVEAQLHKLQSKHPMLRYELLPEVWSHISSSRIRTTISSSGKSEDVPSAVMEYIKKQSLY